LIKFNGDQKKTAVQFARYFKASPERVWQAWTDPAFFTWFGGDPNGKVLSANLDVRVGGPFEITFANSDLRTFTCSGQYTEVKPYSKLIFTWSWHGEPDVESVVKVELVVQGIGTLMHFEHSNLDSNSTHDHDKGWKSAFRKFEKILGD
jgi:uncharacterized protein YndB with AHSA1/START domain